MLLVYLEGSISEIVYRATALSYKPVSVANSGTSNHVSHLKLNHEHLFKGFSIEL